MDIRVAKKVVDYVLSNEELFPEDNVIFDFIGGEPLLEIKLIQEIVDYATKKMTHEEHRWRDDYKIRLTTNGLMYSSLSVQHFITKYKKRLNIVMSIDGTKYWNDINRVFPNGEGSYNHIIGNLKLWISQFPMVSTNMVVSHDNVSNVFENARHLLELGIKKLNTTIQVEDVWKNGDETVLEEQLIKLADYVVDNNMYYDYELYVFEEGIGYPIDSETDTSPCGSKLLSVDSSGNFYTCLRFANYSLREKEPRMIGNVFQGIDKNKLRPFIAINHTSISIGDCSNCEVASGCKWCPAENYDSSSTGTLFQRSTAVCKMHKARVRARNYYKNRIVSRENGRIWNI